MSLPRVVPAPPEPPRGTPFADVAVISVSIELGAERRGVDMGPSAIRIAGLTRMLEELGYDVLEAGTVHASVPETIDPGETRTRYLRRSPRSVGAPTPW